MIRKEGKLCPLFSCLPTLTARHSLTWSGSCEYSRNSACSAKPRVTLIWKQAERIAHPLCALSILYIVELYPCNIPSYFSNMPVSLTGLWALWGEWWGQIHPCFLSASLRIWHHAWLRADTSLSVCTSVLWNCRLVVGWWKHLILSLLPTHVPHLFLRFKGIWTK